MIRTLRDRKYLGMTALQISILAIMGTCNLCLLGGGAILVLGLPFRTQVSAIPSSPTVVLPTPTERRLPTSTPVPTLTAQELPPHKLTVVRDPFGGTLNYWLLIVVNKGFQENQARTLVRYYDRLYDSARSLIIDFHCDGLYATEEAIKNQNLKDTEYYSHVLYSYTRSKYQPSGEFQRGEEITSHSVCR